MTSSNTLIRIINNNTNNDIDDDHDNDDNNDNDNDNDNNNNNNILHYFTNTRYTDGCRLCFLNFDMA